MTDDRKYMMAGALADEQVPDGTLELTEVAPFDPIQALRDQGLLSEDAIPQEVELEQETRGIAPDENGRGDARDIEEPRPVTEMDLNAFRTVHDGESEIQDTLESPPLLVPTPGGNPKDAIGATKPDISLVPPAGLLYESQAMMDGAYKYGPYNWRKNPVLYRVYIAAAMRHLQQLLDGEDFDPISGVHHIGHARACLGIMADANETGNLIDDRPVKGAAGEMIRRFGDTGSYAK